MCLIQLTWKFKARAVQFSPVFLQYGNFCKSNLVNTAQSPGTTKYNSTVWWARSCFKSPQIHQWNALRSVLCVVHSHSDSSSCALAVLCCLFTSFFLGYKVMMMSLESWSWKSKSLIVNHTNTVQTMKVWLIDNDTQTEGESVKVMDRSVAGKDGWRQWGKEGWKEEKRDVRDWLITLPQCVYLCVWCGEGS